MNYKNKKLKFNFDLLKQLLHNLVLASCVAIIAAFVVVHFSNSAISVVLSASMSPEIVPNDVLVVKKQKEYFVGDIIQFDDESTGLNITHRIVSVKQGQTGPVYVCKGDAEKLLPEQNCNKKEELTNMSDYELLNTMTINEIKIRFSDKLQFVEYPQIKGKIVEKLYTFTIIRNCISKLK